MATVWLTGVDLGLADLEAVAQGAPVALAPEGLERMAVSRAVIDRAVAERRPVYGVTTGLGPRVVEALPEDVLGDFSRRTIRGRAHALGAPLPAEDVRAAMAVRLNTLLTGASGARPEIAEALAAVVNAGLVPVLGETASIGAADLLWGGSLSLTLLGEGEMLGPNGTEPAASALASAGLAPLSLGPRDGLALTSHSSVSAGIAALAVGHLGRVYEAAQTAAALSLEAFRGNLSPFDPRVIALRPQPGQAEAAEALLARLHGSGLHAPGAARRLQDPLSFRNIAQLHGAAFAALDHARIAVLTEINAASDNPAVLVEDGAVLSGGGYLTPHLAIALTGAAQGWAHLAAGQCARIGKLLAQRFTDLPMGLVPPGADAAGLGPLLKIAEALMAEIVHQAQPAPVYPGFSADGLEDVVSHTAIAAKALRALANRAARLVAIELAVAAQALDLRGEPAAPRIAEAHSRIRRLLPLIEEDQPLAAPLEGLARQVSKGDFA